MSRRSALVLLVAVVLLGLVGWMCLSQASEAAEMRHHIQELHQQKKELLRENDQLTYDIARLASVERLEKRARELGYVTVRQAHFVLVAYPLQDEITPNEAMAVAQSNSAERATSSATPDWWQAVTEQFEAWAQTEQP